MNNDTEQVRQALFYAVEAGRDLLRIGAGKKYPPPSGWTEGKAKSGVCNDVNKIDDVLANLGEDNLAIGIRNGAPGISIDCDDHEARGSVQSILDDLGIETLAFDTPRGARFEFLGGEGIPEIAESMSLAAGYGALATRAAGKYGLVAPSRVNGGAYKPEDKPPGAGPWVYTLRTCAPVAPLPVALREVLIAIRPPGTKSTVRNPVNLDSLEDGRFLALRDSVFRDAMDGILTPERAAEWLAHFPHESLMENARGAIAGALAKAKAQGIEQDGKKRRRAPEKGHNGGPPIDEDANTGEDEINDKIILDDFLRQRGENVLYDTRKGKWREWNDDTGWQIAKTIKADLLDIIDPIARSSGKKRSVEKWVIAPVSERILRLARDCSEHADWDDNPYIAGLPSGGVVDLHTGTTRPPRRKDYITRRTAIDPADTEGEFWPKLICDWTGEDPELARFLQVVAGSCLTGIVPRHFYILDGIGSNGKSGYSSGIAAALGEYATNMPARTIVGKREEHLAGIAKLAGARFAYCSEPVVGGALKSGLLKELTGGEVMSANYMRQNHFDFRPTQTTFLSANGVPKLNHVDQAIKDRLRIIPFNMRFDPLKRPRLMEEIKQHAPEVLRWLINGAKMFLAERQTECGAVTIATEAYMQDQDSVTAWVNAECTLTPKGKMPVREIHTQYKQWCRANDYNNELGELEWRKAVSEIADVVFKRREGKDKVNRFLGISYGKDSHV